MDSNAIQAELDKFSEIAPRWWDEAGPVRTLHQINPLRIEFIQSCVPLAKKKILDIGCGGGILCEGLAKLGAEVTGIDLAKSLIQTAQLHQFESQLTVNYEITSAEEYATQQAGRFDVVTCMEMLEHVPDPAAIVKAAAQLCAPGGVVFFSTINRTPAAFLKAIVGAEYCLNLLPKGTHEYERFIQPAELARFARTSGLELVKQQGISFNLFTKQFALDKSIDTNYLACFVNAQ